MASEKPTHFVIFGSESDALIDFINSIEKICKIIRIYNHQVPTPRENCIDISDLTLLESILKNLDSSSEVRLAFVGVASRSQASLFVRESLENLLGIVDTNVNSYIRLLHVLLPQMIKNNYGRLVYLSSFRSEHIGRGSSVYSASKSFCENLFSSIGKELGSFNIVSTSIRMGFFEGRMFDSLPKEMIARCLQQVSLRRKGRSSELSNAIWFALGNEYTNGGVIELDGGISYDW
jgi:NAD(P)-dependent dehydrogenase (short-subunit alcohol dehydrogenase family)